MKRILYLASILITGALITFYSCTKENENITVKTDECLTCGDGTALAMQIKQFETRLETARQNPYKDGEEITKEEAIDNMEMLFNASHSFATETYTRIQVDTVEFDLAVNGQGNIQITDVAAAYDGLHNSVKTVYDNINFTDKHLVTLVLYSNETNTVKAVSTTGDKGIDPPQPTPFENCWWYGENQGMCDGTLQWELDGGDTLANVLFHNRPFPIIGCPPGNHLITVPDYGETFEGNGPLEEGYIFYLQKDIGSGFTDDEKQLSVDEMNLWYNQEYEFLFTVLPQNKPWNWVMTSIVIDGIEDTDDFNRWIHHQNIVEYGLVLCVPNDIIDPPSDL